MQKRKAVIGIILVTMLLSAFLLIQPIAAEETGYQNISVQKAHKMIKNNPGIIILDVRNQSEYDLGHLYDAILMPVFKIENGTTQIQDHINDKIIVYCKAGSRSAEACQILVEQGFTKVYNMIGGITAWMEANYPIYTSYHSVTVDFAEHSGKTLIDIQPSLLYQDDCACQNQTGSGSTAPIAPNITRTVLEENENYTVVFVTEEINGTIREYTVNTTSLWGYTELKDDFNRTITFTSMLVTWEGNSMYVFRLQDDVKHKDYNLTVITTLSPLDSETYNTSSTLVNYAPVGKTGIMSLEKVTFNTSVTMSQLYASLGKVAQKVGKIYEKSEDENLTIFAERYYTMANELKSLSKIVKTHLSEYNKNILNNKAIIMDSWLYCSLCIFALNIFFTVGCYILCSCVGGWACGVCWWLWNNQEYTALPISYICYMIIGCESLGEPSYHYLTSTTEYEYSGTVDNHEYLRGSSNDGNYAHIHCSNIGNAAWIIGTFDEEYVHGGISIYGKSGSGYYSDLYVYVSSDGQNWNLVGSQCITSTSSYWIDFGYVTDCFSYIGIAGYDSANSVCLYLDSVRVTA